MFYIQTFLLNLVGVDEVKRVSFNVKIDCDGQRIGVHIVKDHCVAVLINADYGIDPARLKELMRKDVSDSLLLIGSLSRGVFAVWVTSFRSM